MRRRVLLLALSLTPVLLLLSAAQAEACTCAGAGSPCEAFGGAAAVSQPNDPTNAYTRTFYPGVARAEEAEAIELKAGSTESRLGATGRFRATRGGTGRWRKRSC